MTTKNTGNTVLTCQNTCSSGLTCSGGCSLTNGQYIGNWIQTSCCSGDYCNKQTTSATPATAATSATAAIVKVSSCYVGIEPTIEKKSCPTGSTDLCIVNTSLFFFKTLSDR